jgi:opioid growth factor receptor-like protein
MNFADFYLEKAPDHLGRKLEDILCWSDDKLEVRHDFIQILFPLTEPSAHIPSAPVLDAATLAEFQKNPTIQQNLLRSFQLMLRFYGFQLIDRDVPEPRIVPAADFPTKSANWLFLGDHNFLRITRILKCLSACGLPAYAAAFLQALLAVADPEKVSAETVGYWKRAVAKDG